MASNYQDTFLSTVRKENIPLTIYLTSGFQIRCTIRAFDNFVVVVEVEGKQQMIYKHAISTLAPIRDVLNLPE